MLTLLVQLLRRLHLLLGVALPTSLRWLVLLLVQRCLLSVAVLLLLVQLQRRRRLQAAVPYLLSSLPLELLLVL